MKIAVIGGAGYIGSHTVRELLDRGHEVCVFDNLSSGLEQNLFPEAGFVKGDILHPDEIEKFLKDFKPEGLVHLAAFKAAGESMLNPEKYSVNNITGSINILNAATAAGVTYNLGHAAVDKMIASGQPIPSRYYDRVISKYWDLARLSF